MINAKHTKGVILIKNFVKNLPAKPGVYRMYNENSEVLYVGKAKNLKNRVNHYTRTEAHNNRITHMINATCHMEFIVTKSESEALLLEASLIKHLNPQYNILLKDDKTLPYIFIKDHYRAPSISKHRGARLEKGSYFGPFATPRAVNETIATIQQAFLLRVCSDSAFEKRKRPCLLYQMKRCSGPCTYEISDESYSKLVRETKTFLKGKNNEILKQLTESMEKASKLMEYEQAAIYRDRIASLRKLQQKQTVHLTQTDEADIFALARQGGLVCIQVFFYRYSQNWGNRSYFPKADEQLDENEILQSFLMQFYDNKPIPKRILVPYLLPETKLVYEALQSKSEHKIEIIQPQRGEKKAILDHALLNAKEALARKIAETTTQKYLFEKFSKTFQLKKIPTRIEIYDNSHLMGQNAIGAMVVASPQGFLKTQYRKFNIKSKETVAGDDYAMMREVIKRRFNRLLKETPFPATDDPNVTLPENPYSPWPDVLLIDGGKGQLSAVTGVLNELNLLDKIEIIAIAKGKDRNAGREWFFMNNRLEFQLSPRDEILYFVQRLRDEAHRFAIGVQRNKRQKSTFINPLNEISNIGPTRKRALLQHFGSAKAIKNATVEEISQIKGISKTLAEKILAELKF